MKGIEHRRDWLKGTGLATLGAALAFPTSRLAAAPAQRSAAEPFGYCMNTATLRGHKLSLSDEIEIAAKAGYQAIEPWISELRSHVEGGGKLADLAKRLSDAGLTVESAIGFAEWVVDDEDQRRRGLEAMKGDMELVRAVGGKRIAAPPTGATKQVDLNLYRAAERYRALLELGEREGVVPQIELWGFSQSLKRLGEVLFVGTESGHRDACILADVYHLYKGGNAWDSLRMINGQTMHVLHMNDYPAQPSREEITDAQRVYPGDGVAPLKQILRTLRDIGYRGYLSLELFNRDYWSQDPVIVAKTGLEKMRVAVLGAELGKEAG